MRPPAPDFLSPEYSTAAPVSYTHLGLHLKRQAVHGRLRALVTALQLALLCGKLEGLAQIVRADSWMLLHRPHLSGSNRGQNHARVVRRVQFAIVSVRGGGQGFFPRPHKPQNSLRPKGDVGQERIVRAGRADASPRAARAVGAAASTRPRATCPRPLRHRRRLRHARARLPPLRAPARAAWRRWRIRSCCRRVRSWSGTASAYRAKG